MINKLWSPDDDIRLNATISEIGNRYCMGKRLIVIAIILLREDWSRNCIHLSDIYRINSWKGAKPRQTECMVVNALREQRALSFEQKH